MRTPNPFEVRLPRCLEEAGRAQQHPGGRKAYPIRGAVPRGDIPRGSWFYWLSLALILHLVVLFATRARGWWVTLDCDVRRADARGREGAPSMPETTPRCFGTVESSRSNVVAFIYWLRPRANLPGKPRRGPPGSVGCISLRRLDTTLSDVLKRRSIAVRRGGPDPSDGVWKDRSGWSLKGSASEGTAGISGHFGGCGRTVENRVNPMIGPGCNKPGSGVPSNPS